MVIDALATALVTPWSGPSTRAAPAAASSPTLVGGRAKKLPSYEPDPMATRETLELVRAYYKIENANVRKRAYDLIKGVGATGA